MADEYRRMRQLTGTPLEWSTSGLIIGDAEIAVERTGNKSRIKLGDGFSTFVQLPYLDVGNAGGGNVTANTLAKGDGQGGLVNSLIVDNGTTVVTNGDAIINGSLVLDTTLNVAGAAAFAGAITVPTAAPGTNNTQAANTAFVTAALAAGTSNFVLRTGDTMTDRLTVSAGGIHITGDSQFINTVQGPTAAPGTSNTQLATTAFVQNALGGGGGIFVLRAGDTMNGPLNVNASAGITTPLVTADEIVGETIRAVNLITGPTVPANSDNDELATTRYVDRAIAANPGGIPEAPTDGQVYNRRGSDASWQVATGGGGGGTDQLQKREFVAVGGETSFAFSSEYQVGTVSVYINGVRQSGQDFTATDGTNVVLANAVLANDIVLIESFLGAAVPATGVPEAPNDGQIYSRRGSDQSWQIFEIPTEIVISDGVSAGPSLSFVDDNFTGLFRPGPDEFGLTVSGNEAMRLTAEGRVGIGYAPGLTDATLETGSDWAGGGGGMIRANIGGIGSTPTNPGLIIRNLSQANILTKSCTLMAQGRTVGGVEIPDVGTLSWMPVDVDWTSTSVSIDVRRAGAAHRPFIINEQGVAFFEGFNENSFAPNILTTFLRGRNAYNANPGAGIAFGGRYTSAGNIGDFAFISGIKENNVDGDYGGALVFGVRPNGSGPGNMEKARLNAQGQFHVRGEIVSQRVTGGVPNGGTITGDGGSANSGYLRFTMPGVGAPSGGYIGFMTNIAGAHVNYQNEMAGGGGHNFGQACYAPAFNPASDERLKTNIKPSTEDSGAIIDAIEIVAFDWIADGKHQSFGLIAQKLYESYPESVTPATTDDGIWSYDPAKLLMVAIKEIQNLRARVAQLEAVS